MTEDGAGRSESFVIDVGGSPTTALVYSADSTRASATNQQRPTLILAHGAGAPQTHPWMVRLSRALAARDVRVITFNFLYTEAKRRTPDKNDVLESTWRAVIRALQDSGGDLYIGGKSMGGRIASQVAAKSDVDVAGVVLLGYPLHPPGRPTELRVRHLPQVRAPMLFVQGSRDPFGTPAELGPIVKDLAAGTRMFVVEEGDHSFAVPKRLGQTLETVIARVADEVISFMGST